MKIDFVKQAGGLLIPATDMDAERMTKFKTGETYPVEIKRTRNPDFHRKVFAFFHFCFDHWKGDNEFQSEALQFDVFRRHMTVLAGHYDQYVGIDHKVRIEAKSLSYGSMEQEEFEEVYNALIQVAMQKLFTEGDTEEVYNQLVGFF